MSADIISLRDPASETIKEGRTMTEWTRVAALEDIPRLGARVVKSALGADGMTLHQFSESAGGQVIFHLHFHLLPRWEGVALRPPGVMADDARLAEQAEKIRSAMPPFKS